jgi:putative methyltransferase (TIGR04325 family)
MPQFRGKPLTLGRIVRSVRGRLFDSGAPLNSCKGVYSSFAEAMKAAPPSKPLGYDAANSANWYLGKLDSLLLEDYPVVYWLRSALQDSRTVFEIGGHIGEAYYGFSRVLPYPADLQWTICDVPTIAEAGRKLAHERGRTNLHFVTSLRETEGADVLLAAGALQYFEPRTLAEVIAPFRVRPRHILVNVTPVYDGPSFVTLQNIGSAYCPYRIFSRPEFVGALEQVGYTLVDSWRKDRALSIPGHPDKSFDHYSGFYFRAN